MSISGLNINSNLCCQRWILNNYNGDTQDKHSDFDFSDIDVQFKPDEIFYYHWNRCDSPKFKHSKNNLFTDEELYSLDEKFFNISKSLSKFMNDWILSYPSFYLSNESRKLTSDILISIRDSLFLSVCNIFKSTRHRGIHGFIISSKKDLNLYEHTLKLCKNAFWLPKEYGTQANDNRSTSIYTINFGDYSGSQVPKLCYTSRNYLVTCCCERCTRVLDYLNKNHEDPFSYGNLEKLVLTELNSLTKFLIHNKKYQTLEYKLLRITFSGLILKNHIQTQFNAISTVNESGLKTLFKSYFVLFKNYELLSNCSFESGRNPLSLCSLVIDLLCEYTELWEDLDLPIFSFILLQTQSETITNQPVTHDDSLCSDPFSLLHSSTHFKYSTVVYDEVINENAKFEYLQDMLKNSSNGESSYNFDILRSLMRLTRGYNLDDLKILARLAKCECAKDKSNNFYEDVVRYFEKALSLKPIVEFSNNLGSYPEISSFSKFLNFSPLKLENGKVFYKRGLESLVLQPELLDKINSFLSEQLGPDSPEPTNSPIAIAITGDSGVGKTTLAHCIAQEMNAVFFSLNVLHFLRPQVGLSEKLFHTFISRIRAHFSGSNTGSRRDLVKCVILLEGLEALNGDDGYLKRLVSALRFEIDGIRSQSLFALDYSILFITTCQKISNLPEKILKVLSNFILIPQVFSQVIEISTPEMVRKCAKDCFELFLNQRCNFLHEMDEFINYISKKNYLTSLTPLKIASLSKNASLKAATDPSNISIQGIDTPNGNLDAKLVTMDIMISIMDSTFNQV